MRPSPFMSDRHDIKSVAPGNPAAGSLLTWNVPAKQVVQIISVKINLTTSIDVADRHILVYVSDAGILIPTTPAAIVQPANKSWTYYFTIGIAPLNMTTETGDVYQPLGCCYQLEDGSSLIVNVKNIAGTDRLAAAAIRYFLWDRG